MMLDPVSRMLAQRAVWSTWVGVAAGVRDEPEEEA